MQPAEAMERAPHEFRAMAIASYNALQLCLSFARQFQAKDPKAYQQVQETAALLEQWMRENPMNATTSLPTMTVRPTTNEEVIIPANLEWNDDDWLVYESEHYEDE